MDSCRLVYVVSRVTQYVIVEVPQRAAVLCGAAAGCGSVLEAVLEELQPSPLAQGPGDGGRLQHLVAEHEFGGFEKPSTLAVPAVVQDSALAARLEARIAGIGVLVEALPTGALGRGHAVPALAPGTWEVSSRTIGTVTSRPRRRSIGSQATVGLGLTLLFDHPGGGSDGAVHDPVHARMLGGPGSCDDPRDDRPGCLLPPAGSNIQACVHGGTCQQSALPAGVTKFPHGGVEHFGGNMQGNGCSAAELPHVAECAATKKEAHSSSSSEASSDLPAADGFDELPPMPAGFPGWSKERQAAWIAIDFQKVCARC